MIAPNLVGILLDLRFGPDVDEQGLWHMRVEGLGFRVCG